MILLKSGSLLRGKTPFFARGQGGPRAKNGVRRVSAFLCAFLMIIHLAFFPVRARAAATAAVAGALTAVGFAVTVAAFLNAAGVFPYWSGGESADSDTFDIWSNDNLQYLIDKYNATSPLSPVNTSTIKGYALGATVMIAHNSWVALRAFVQWLQSEFSLTDNQTEVKLGTVSDSWLALPHAGTASENMSSGLLLPDGIRLSYYSYQSELPGAYPVLLFYNSGNEVVYYVFLIGGRDDTSVYFDYFRGSSGRSSIRQQVGNVFCALSSYYYTMSLSDAQLLNVPIYSTYAEGRQACIDYFYSDNPSDTFSGVTADTSTISVPAELPTGSEFGGLTVAGLGEGATPRALQSAIEQGVMEREKPDVRPVSVEISPDVDVDSSTGEITENPVTITVSDIPLSLSNFSVPSLSSVFPFSVPYDMYRVLSALNAEPVRPDFDVTIYNPISPSSPFELHIGIPDDISEMVDNFMSLFRNMIFVAVFIALLMWARSMINL